MQLIYIAKQTLVDWLDLPSAAIYYVLQAQEIIILTS